MDRTSANRCRFDPARAAGHYESYFQRANHPSRPLAFWIRYTIFSPKGRPDQTVGELWASYFDGEKRCITAVKEAFPLAECRFSPTELNMQIGRATLDERSLHGEARTGDRHLQWNLNYSGDAPPLLLLSPALYNAPFPKAKALVGTPLASYGGLLIVDGETIPINGWVGSQNHNWGSRHIDHYAWGQVAGFDGAPDAFLEISTARIRLGPVWSPWLTPVVLRAEGQEYALNGLLRSALSFGRFDMFTWRFDAGTGRLRIHGEISAEPEAFVALNYDNPPGGSKTCLNTKLARCTVTLERAGQLAQTFHTEHRAAFEILTDDPNHGVLPDASPFMNLLRKFRRS